MAELNIARELKEIKSMLRQTTKIKSWVNGQTMTQITVWDSPHELRKARINGYVEYKQEGKSLLYNLDSIHPIFFKAK